MAKMKKTPQATMIFMLLNIIICNAQVLEKSTFYENDSNLLKEKYYVLKSDTSLKDSLYLKYSSDGKLINKGFYNKGDKLGEWVRFFPDFKIKSSGYYDMNNQYNGCNFHYLDNGKIDHVDYYIDGIAYNDSLYLQQDFIIKLFDGMHTSGFDSYEVMSSNFAALEIDKARYDSIDGQDDKFAFGNTIIEQGYFYKEWFPIFKTKREKLIKTNSEINEFSVSLDKAYFDLIMNPIKNLSDSLLTSGDMKFVLTQAPLIHTEFASTSGLLLELDTIDTMINKELQEIDTQYKHKFPEFYAAESNRFIQSQEDYMQEENLQIRISKGSELIKVLEKMNGDFVRLDELNVAIDEKQVKLEKAFKEKYPVDYQVEEETINTEYSEFQASTQLTQKIQLGEKVLEHLKNSYIGFYTVDSMDMVINEDFKPLREGYLQSFPSIYAKEIKPVATEIAELNRTKGLDQKIKTGQQIIDTIGYYTDTYNRFIEIDNALKDRYSVLQTNFKENYRAIYKNEVAHMDNLIKKYQVNNRSESKLVAGNNIMNKIEELDDNYSKIEAQRKEINQRYPAISDKFLNDFPPIHKNTVRLYDDKKALYEKSLNCKSFLENGNSFIEEIEILESKYNEISMQFSEIEGNLSQVENMYQIDFSEVYNTEIKEEKTKIKEYNNEGFIEKKLKTGEFILTKLKTLQEAFPQLKEENTKMNNEYATLVQEFKINFPVLYKTYIIPLIADEKSYRQNGYHAPKMTLSNKIVQKIDEFRAKYDLFKAQNDLLLSNYDEFIYNYEGRNQYKKMYKKGKWAYNELKNKYDNEISFEKKEKIGKEIELMLLQFISLSTKDNTIINEEIKSAKTVNDVLKVIGIN